MRRALLLPFLLLVSVGAYLVAFSPESGSTPVTVTKDICSNLGHVVLIGGEQADDSRDQSGDMVIWHSLGRVDVPRGSHDGVLAWTGSSAVFEARAGWTADFERVDMAELGCPID